MNSPILDDVVFTELQMLMEDAMPEFIHTYMDNSPKLIQQIDNAISAVDAATMFHAAHQLKGGSGSLGAVRITQIAADIEALGKESSVLGADTLLLELESEYKKLTEQLQRYL